MATVTVTAKDRENKRNGNTNGSSSSSVNSTSKSTQPTGGTTSGLTSADISNYGTAPKYEANPDFAKDFDYDARINAAISSGASQDTINGLKAQKEYAEGVRNGTVKEGGYGEGFGYGNRETAFTFDLGDGNIKNVYSNATTYQDAAKQAGIDLNNAKLLRSATYGTKSSAYSPKGYGFGTISGPDDFTTDIYANDEQTGRFYDMQNMQLAFLEGRDGFHYSAPITDANYGDLQNAYNKGTQFAGQGDIMGGYNVNFQYPDGSTLNDVIASYGQQEFAMPEIQGNFINPSTGANETYQDILDKYEEAIAQNNAAQASYFKQQLDLANQQYDDTQRENYINYMMAQKNLPAQLQAQGVNGGMAESTRSALESEYMSNYNQAEIARHNTSTEINVAAQQAAASNNMQAAEIYAGIAQSMLQYEQAEAHYQQQYQLSLMQMQQAQTQWEREFAYQQAQDAQAYALQAQQLASQERQLAIEYAYQVEDWNTYAQLTGMNTGNMQKKSNSVGSGSKGKSVSSSMAYDLLDTLKTKGQDAAFDEMEKWSVLGGYSDASIDATWDAVKAMNGMNYQNVFDTSSDVRSR